MMIEWNKVTWYSRLIALVLFGALPITGFYLGYHYGRIRDEVRRLQIEAYYNRVLSPHNYESPTGLVPAGTSESNSAGTDSSGDFQKQSGEALADGWKVYRDEVIRFTLHLPSRWNVAARPSDNLVIFSDALSGSGISAHGMRVQVQKSPCVRGNGVFVEVSPIGYVRNICTGGFSILLGYIPEADVERSYYENILVAIAESFALF